MQRHKSSPLNEGKFRETLKSIKDWTIEIENEVCVYVYFMVNVTQNRLFSCESASVRVWKAP